MSKAELFQQLEALSENELTEVALKVEALLQQNEEKSPITATERRILAERIARFRADGNSGEDWSVVRHRVLARYH